MRLTSAAVYHRIKSEGLLSKSRMEIYDWLFYNGPATARETFDGMGVARGEFTRFKEMERQGAIYEVGTRECKITGNEVTEWDVTDRIPSKLAKPTRLKKPSKADFAATVKVMREAYRRKVPGTADPAVVRVMKWAVQEAGETLDG